MSLRTTSTFKRIYIYTVSECVKGVRALIYMSDDTFPDEPQPKRGVFRKVSSSCSTSYTRRVILLKNLMISHISADDKSNISVVITDTDYS